MFVHVGNFPVSSPVYSNRHPLNKLSMPPTYLPLTCVYTYQEFCIIIARISMYSVSQYISVQSYLLATTELSRELIHIHAAYICICRHQIYCGPFSWIMIPW